MWTIRLVRDAYPTAAYPTELFEMWTIRLVRDAYPTALPDALSAR